MSDKQVSPSDLQQANAILVDGFERVKEVVHDALDEIDETTLTYRPNGTGNSIAWLIWHLTRIQDDHVADLRGEEQLWTAGKWRSKFDLPFDASDTGFGHSPSDVAAVKTSAGLLAGYYDTVHAETVTFISALRPDDYDRIVDTSWDPPVTLAVRIISVLSDDLQHAGQAAYVRGLAEKR